MQGGLTLIVDDVGVGSLPQEQAQDVPGLSPDRQVDTGVPQLVRRVSGGAAWHQGLDRVEVTSLHRVTEGGVAPAVLTIHTGAAVQQLVDSSTVASGGGKMERSPGPAVLAVDIRLLEMFDNLV